MADECRSRNTLDIITVIQLVRTYKSLLCSQNLGQTVQCLVGAKTVKLIISLMLALQLQPFHAPRLPPTLALTVVKCQILDFLAHPST